MDFLAPKIKAYLDQAGIAHSHTDFQTEQPADEAEKIVHWDAKLGAQPTQEQLDAAWAAKLAQDGAAAYKTKRAAEYPSIGDQLDALWKGGAAAADMLAQVQAVKDKYPKG